MLDICTEMVECLVPHGTMYIIHDDLLFAYSYK